METKQKTNNNDRVVKSARDAQSHIVRPRQSSRTLMRHIVKKPGPSFKRQIRVSAIIYSNQSAYTRSVFKGPTLSGRKHHLAKQAKRSTLVSHYSKNITPGARHSRYLEELAQTVVSSPERPRQIVNNSYTKKPKSTRDVMEKTMMYQASL